MEGVRIERVECMDEEVVERALYRIVEDLAEALDRTPSTISSKTLIEGALKLAMGSYASARNLLERCRSGSLGEGSGLRSLGQQD